MSHTFRNLPSDSGGMRRPHTLSELKQLNGILADDTVYNTKVSGLNHMRKRQNELGTTDLIANSIHQEDHA